MKHIPSKWETQKLTVQDLKETEIHQAQTLYEKGSHIHQWDGGTLDEAYVKRCFEEGDLPPGGRKEHFKIQVITMKESRDFVGLLITYHGHPVPASFYINYLSIDPYYHKQGLGQEVVKELLEIVKQHGFQEVRANVALKNWGAIRFWSKLGVDTINGVYGDQEHGEGRFADIELMRTL
ncbi:GNAT family N-acetyltransferase [Rossellomorea sp. YZS02]|uniref:GNAT family N-acetyltransferase n=1 Tax=Rossellomorea sp. YZS02 TaxID=3097358 RepID=UPI002A0E3EBF|nr:GNAT family N-acetyltransferase [Rossellomorea sp. YZS02]MDX8344635.1 GNAT family N-acetyltransferase [Rossellomorea sp. YZS02]